MSHGYKIFVIGLSRTGTKSVTRALHSLGYDIRHFPCDAQTVSEVISGRPYSILQHCDGMSDVQASVRFKELAQEFPGSKFILTVREKESWLASCRKHFTSRPLSKIPEAQRGMISTLRRQAYGTEEFDETMFSEAYDRHVAAVFSYFGHRLDLLVIDVAAGEGWDTLCPFLGLPVPDVPFPHIR